MPWLIERHKIYYNSIEIFCIYLYNGYKKHLKGLLLMISFHRIDISSDQFHKNMKDLLEPHSLYDQKVVDKLQKYLRNKCDILEIEYPYYDSDYLSTYYIHYSQKLCNYPKACCRIHIYKDTQYYGYITLRPTVGETKLGKTYLNPSIIIDETAYLINAFFIAHIVGNRISIQGFPWKSQQTDISVCAHTATWTIVRYFGDKYRNYINATIGDIVERTHNEWGRKTPSLGLTPIQVSDILKEYKFTPLIIENIDKNDSASLDIDKNDSAFLDNVLSYIESGLPLIGFLEPIKHAISIIGHGVIDYNLLNNEDFLLKNVDPELDIISHGRLIKDLYVMDDNIFPYQKMSVTLPTQSYSIDYNFNELKYIVVPLYRRMQLTYDDVYARFYVWRKCNVMNWERPCVSRIYITASTSLKQKALECSDMNEVLKEIIITLPLPKFVWCIDLSGYDNYKNKMISGRIIIDTTAATMENEPWILRHDDSHIQFKDLLDTSSPNEYYEVSCNIKPYSLYRNNLGEFNPIS